MVLVLAGLVPGCTAGYGVSIVPLAPRTDDRLVAVLAARVAGDSADTVELRWEVDGEEAGIDGPVVEAGDTVRGEQWRVIATVRDDVFEATVDIGDTPPSVTALSVSPDPARPGEPLLAVLQIADADGDTPTVVTTWSRDGVPTEYAGMSVPPAVTRAGETWSVTAVVTAGGVEASPVSASVAVVNAAPEASAVVVTPDPPTVVDALSATVDWVDGDGDVLHTSWRWLADGVVIEGEVSDLLTAGSAVKGTSVVAEATADDGYGGVTVVTSAPVVVADSGPAITGVGVAPAPITASDLPRCAPEGWTDADGDLPQYTFTWEVDGADGGTTELLDRMPEGTTLRCTATPTDGELVGAPWTSDEVVVGNGRPYGAVPALSPADPTFGIDDLVCARGAPPVDPEGEPFTTAIGWAKDGVAWVGETATTVEPGDTIPAWVAATGRTWACQVLATDPHGTGVAGEAVAVPTPAETNVLILLADDVGVDKIGAYALHPSPANTPVIDSLADSGVRFERFWATHGCSSSRSELLTGRYTRRYGIGGIIETLVDTAVLPDEEVLVPEMLTYAPTLWDTSFAGKWHLTSAIAGGGVLDPYLQGFAWHAGSMENLGVSWLGLPEPLGYGRWEKNTNGVLAEHLIYATTDTTDDAIAQIGAMTEPWLMWTSFNSAHYPIHAPPVDLTSVDVDKFSTDLEKYEAMLEALDTEIGRLLASIDPDVLARTTVIFMGDNGTSEYGTEPPWDPEMAKSTIYEPGVRVPLIVSGPLVRTPGVQSPALTVAVDLYDTIAAVAGVVVPEADAAAGVEVRDGVSFLPYLADPFRASRRTYTYTDKFLPNGPPPYNIDRRAACDGRFKLMRHRNGYRSWEEFYDLQGVPFETVDLLTLGPLDAEQQAAYDALTVELDAKEAALVYAY